MVLAFNPKLRPLELLKVMALRLLDVVPALTLMLVRDVATDAVTVLAFSPKLTPLLFENVTADRLLLVVPAEMLKLVRLVATDAVTVFPLTPKLTPLELLNTASPLVMRVVPALRDRMPCEVRATVPPASGRKIVRFAVGCHARCPCDPLLLKMTLLAPASVLPIATASPLTDSVEPA